MNTADLFAAGAYASKFDLRRFAEMRLAGLVAQGSCDATRPSRERLSQVLSVFLEDGGPTPQVGSTPTRAVEIQWLCDRALVSAIIEQDGYLSILAEGGSVGCPFEHEVDAGEQISTRAVAETQALLRQMSRAVRSRPADWPSAR